MTQSITQSMTPWVILTFKQAFSDLTSQKYPAIMKVDNVTFRVGAVPTILDAKGTASTSPKFANGCNSDER